VFSRAARVAQIYSSLVAYNASASRQEGAGALRAAHAFSLFYACASFFFRSAAFFPLYGIIRQRSQRGTALKRKRQDAAS